MHQAVRNHLCDSDSKRINQLELKLESVVNVFKSRIQRLEVTNISQEVNVKYQSFILLKFENNLTFWF